MSILNILRRKKKEKPLKPVIIDIDRLATRDDIKEINKELQDMKISPRERRELAIAKKWYSWSLDERKEYYGKLRIRQRRTLLGILARQKGKQDGKI